MPPRSQPPRVSGSRGLPGNSAATVQMFQNQLHQRTAQQAPVKNKPLTGRTGGIAGAMGRYQQQQQQQPVEEEEGDPQLPSRITIHQAVNLLSLRMCNVETQLIDMHRKSFESATGGGDAGGGVGVGGGGGDATGSSGETVLMLMQRLDQLEHAHAASAASAARPAVSSVELASLRMDLGKIRSSLAAVVKEAQSLRSRVETHSADIMQLKCDVISALDTITASADAPYEEEEEASAPLYHPDLDDAPEPLVTSSASSASSASTTDDAQPGQKRSHDDDVQAEPKAPRIEPSGTTPLF